MTTRVLLVRHGQSEGNVARVWTSAREGFPLTPLGHEQAAQVARTIAGRQPQAVYASVLLRAQQTAPAIADAAGLEVQLLDGVEELHVGVHEGGHDDVVGPVAIEVFGRWWRDGDLSGGFDGGETGEQIVARMRAALDGVADAHPGGTVVVVSHGGAMALASQAMCGIDPLFVAHHLLANTDVVELVRTDEDGWACASWAGTVPDLQDAAGRA